MVDVCLVLEGTYPYVTGGVSTWIHQLVTSLPRVSFGIVHLSVSQDVMREYKYKMPPNIRFFHEIFLHQYQYSGIPRFEKMKQAWEKQYRSWHADVQKGNFSSFPGLIRQLHAGKKHLGADEMLFSKKSWAMVEDFYAALAPEQSFIDYFWTWRFTHLPLFILMQHELPRAAVYHTISSGYAGLFAVLAKMRTRRPVLVTEHGIYTRERKIEIQDAEWIHHDMRFTGGDAARNYFKDLWIRMFSFMSRLLYTHADGIITLSNFNKAIQMAEGAPADRIRIIPNGVVPEDYAAVRQRYEARPAGGPGVIGFVGRVVSIKDVKTFIRAVKTVTGRLPGVTALIIGPTDEEEEYYRECLELVRMLELEDAVTFTGRADMKEYYHRLDVVVLTSVSEAQPLVILEAHCVGLPVVSTDVGACREMLEGREGHDRHLGPGGLLTRVADPAGTADAVTALLKDDRLRRTMGRAGRLRTEQFYRQQDLLARYTELYEQLKFAPDAED